MKKANNFQIAKVRLKVLLSFCLIFLPILAWRCLYKKRVLGTANGMKFAPPHAILFMADLEKKMLKTYIFSIFSI